MPQKEFQPVHDHQSGVFDLAYGGKFNLYDPQPRMIDHRDIANALSNICRWGGQILDFYSVAQHSSHVAALAYTYDEPPEVQKMALLHDASEAYIFDAIAPLKEYLGDRYKELEMRVNQAIFTAFGLDPALIMRVKPYDLMALEREWEGLVKGTVEMSPKPYNPSEAEGAFLRCYELLFAE